MLYITITFIIPAIVGFIFGFVVRNNIEGGDVLKYFGTPGREKQLELNWGLRQFFYLFSEKMGQRWYEARCHTYSGVFISLLATFRLIYIIRFEYGTEIEDRMVVKKCVIHGFRSYENLLSIIPAMAVEKQEQTEGALYWYQTFVAGHNVVGDFCNGFF
jgi:hypothetical protein